MYPDPVGVVPRQESSQVELVDGDPDVLGVVDGDDDGDDEEGDGDGEDEDGDGDGDFDGEGDLDGDGDFDGDLDGDGDFDGDLDGEAEGLGITAPDGYGTTSVDAAADGLRNADTAGPRITAAPFRL